jgi:MFS family permease
MAFIDSTVVNVALPAIQATFHATVVNVQWVVESYGLFLGALILVGGSLGDLFGRRMIFVPGVMVFAIASATCGFALNIHPLIVARSVQGVGAALLVPGVLRVICTDPGKLPTTGLMARVVESLIARHPPEILAARPMNR